MGQCLNGQIGMAVGIGEDNSQIGFGRKTLLKAAKAGIAPQIPQNVHISPVHRHHDPRAHWVMRQGMQSAHIVQANCQNACHSDLHPCHRPHSHLAPRPA